MRLESVRPQRDELPERAELRAAGLELGDHGRDPHLFFISDPSVG
jgi:hypothetical protein